MLSSNEDYIKEEQLISDFKKDVESAKYGEHLKKICSLEDEPVYDISETLYQCTKCWHLGVTRNKNILFKKDSSIFSHQIFIRQQCPECGSSDYRKAGLHPLCPHCKNELHTINMWRD